MKENVQKALCVRMLGGFSITYGETPLPLGKRSQSRFLQLFQILALYRENGIAIDKLTEALYEWEEAGNRNRCLNHLIDRLKKWLAAAGLPEREYVCIKDGVCAWCGSVPLKLDVSEFRHESDAARHSAGEEERLFHLARAFGLYRGELLPQLACESWVLLESIELKRRYEHCVRELGALYKTRGDFQRMYRVYSAAARLYPFEEWQEGQTESLMLMERYDEAYRLYQETVRRYSDELGLPPSQGMLDHFRIIREKLRQPEESFMHIRENLAEESDGIGAYYCSYPSFVDAYRLLRRIAERSGQSAFLISCTLRQCREDKEKKNSRLVANWLKKVICKSLRRGDVCTRYSKNQYLILLVGMRQEDSCIVLKRIERHFSDKAGTEGYRLDFSTASAINV